MKEQTSSISPVGHFEFWKPVTVNEPFGESVLSRCALRLGEWADRLLYYRMETLKVNAEYVDTKTDGFTKDQISKDSIVFTIIKITILLTTVIVLPYISPYFLALPLTALAIKSGYKYYLNSRINVVKTFLSPNVEVMKKLVGGTKIVLRTGSITEETTDAIVNAANKGLWAGSGVCGAIRNAAGKGVFDECVEILKGQAKNEIKTGEAVLTSSGDLSPKMKAIVHAVGPDCRNDEENAQRAELLAQVYENSLDLLVNLQERKEWISPTVLDLAEPLRSIAFPPISTGIFGYSVAEAAEVALKAIKKYVEAHPGKIKVVHVVCLPADKDPKTVAAYQEAFEQVF